MTHTETPAAHTPAPWRVEDGTVLIWGDCNPDDKTSYGMGYPVAECRGSGWGSSKPSIDAMDANARLIAAAPELLAQLEYAVKLFGAWPMLNGTAQVQSMRDTIAKATGGAA